MLVPRAKIVPISLIQSWVKETPHYTVLNSLSFKALSPKTRLPACCNSYLQNTLCHDPSSTRSEQIKQRLLYFDGRQARFYRYGASRGVARNDYRLPSIIQPRHGTTILCVRKGEEVCLAGDGQVSQGNLVVKPNAKKIRRLPQGVILGFAGATADCFTLLETLEGKLEEHPGQLVRSCVELAKQWRTDRYLRHLEAVLIVADQQLSLEVSGVGDVLESHDGILAVGSGGPYAAAAARALYDIPDMSARQICEKAMKIAADMCCHTNHDVIFETLPNTMTSKTTQDASSILGSD